MEQTSQLRILFIINPISGGKTKKDHEAAIRKYFEEHEHTIEIFILTGKNDAPELKKIIEAVKPHKAVAVGGDGTITMVAKLLLNTDIVLGILPAGSANGMATELNIPTDIEEALHIVLSGQVKKLDVIKINNEICIHLSDIGLNAKLIKRFEEGNIRGMLGYARVALKVFWEKQNIQVIIETKDKQIKRDAFMVALANASKYGTGAVINPTGDLYDGLFEVVIIRRLALSELLKMWFKPQPFDPQKIEVFKASSVQIETRQRVHFQVDGEYLGKVKHVEAKILPGQLNICLPATTQ